MENTKTPYITPVDINDELAIAILENAVFNMSMNDRLDNPTLCLVAAMKRGADALKWKMDMEAAKNE